MINDMAQWAVLSLLAFLMLGLFRQVGMQLPPAVRAAVAGPDVGKKAPDRLLSQIKSISPGALEAADVIVAFVAEHCVSCQRLLGNVATSRGSVAGANLILVARNPSPAFRSALFETGLPTINDTEGKLWRDCHVTATPLLVRLNISGRVTGKEVTHDAERLAAAHT
jgi:hypothetical protein